MTRVLIAGLASLLVACAGATTDPADTGRGSTPTTSPPATIGPIEDPAGTWELTRGAHGETAIEAEPDYPITLIISPGQVGGTAGCNAYGGDYELDGERFSVREIAQTLMACGPAEVMAAEEAYLTALQLVDRINPGPDGLVLTGPDVELVFRSVSGVDERAFVDVRWRLVEGVSDGDAFVPHSPAFVMMTREGTVVGSTGCRDLSGTWSVFGAEVLFPEFSATGDCPPDGADQDQLMVEVLGDGFRVKLVDGLLVVTSQGGNSLTFGAATED